MKNKIWYEIYGVANGACASSDEEILIAKVKGKGTAYIIAQSLNNLYKNIKIK
jgi:hypothetical protein